MSGRGKAMGGVSVNLSDFWSGVSNTAGLTENKSFTLGMAAQNQFLLGELSTGAVAAVFPVEKINGAFGINHFYTGTSTYNEQKTGLAYAHQFGENLSVGLQFDYLFSTSNYAYYDHEHFITFDAGVQYKLNSSLEAGFAIFNPLPIKRVDREDIPSIVKLGILYRITEQLITIVELEKNLLEKQSLRIGGEYEFVNSMYARLGISTNPTIYSFGYGLKFSQFNLDIAAQVHSILGFAPSISIYYTF